MPGKITASIEKALAANRDEDNQRLTALYRQYLIANRTPENDLVSLQHGFHAGWMAAMGVVNEE
jgi:hypothetical protein